MECSKIVFSAARDGNLRLLKRFLDERPGSQRHLLVRDLTNGTTPLIIAAKNGHLDCVAYLVDKCKANIEQVGSIVFDGETIDGAPALWVAAAAGHLHIVAFLLGRNANVNATTKSNSTPLRAACYDGHLDIVKHLVDNNADIEIANRHGHTCLMIACYKGHLDIAQYLVSLGADVNRKSVKGNTALHDCAESGSLQIMKLLLDNNAKIDVDSYGMTPLLAAAVTGHGHIVKYLISRADLVQTRQKIDALELLGATYVDKKRDLHKAKKLWLEALVERCRSGQVLQKSSLPCHAAYNHAVEVTTSEQLEELSSDPDAMRMQALLVRERVLGPAHPDTSYYIRYRGAVYADSGNFSRCTTLWMYALDMQQKILEALSPMTQSSFVSFTELFAFMLNDGPRSRAALIENFEDMLLVLEKAIDEVEKGLQYFARPYIVSRNVQKTRIQLKCNPSNILSNSSRNVDNLQSSADAANTSPILPGHRYMASSVDKDGTHLRRTVMVTLQIIYLATKLYPNMTKEHHQKLHEVVYRLVKLDPRTSNNYSLLHMACSTETMATVGRHPVGIFPNREVVEILLKVGADTMSLDNNMNTPLHVLAQTRCPQSIFKLLLAYGAHYDVANKDGDTFEHIRNLNEKNVKHDEGFINPVPHVSLKCLAARAIKKYEVSLPFPLHSRIEKFIDMHSSY
ncbi:protein fem-1 homolog C [Hyalella azteca]|uniref:Protein fem-1 homolog C n=1 Tax=Hyalella azteca TaxID=294128 RepID=A0A8B7PNE5_HYAAZ|nr:protein fem-1 homolog C [Hyalella azteca]